VKTFSSVRKKLIRIIRPLLTHNIEQGETLLQIMQNIIEWGNKFHLFLTQNNKHNYGVIFIKKLRGFHKNSMSQVY